MREWRNRQTRTFEGRVGDRTGSIPVSRTNKKDRVNRLGLLCFLPSYISNPLSVCLQTLCLRAQTIYNCKRSRKQWFLIPVSRTKTKKRGFILSFCFFIAKTICKKFLYFFNIVLHFILHCDIIFMNITICLKFITFLSIIINNCSIFKIFNFFKFF